MNVIFVRCFHSFNKTRVALIMSNFNELHITVSHISIIISLTMCLLRVVIYHVHSLEHSEDITTHLETTIHAFLTHKCTNNVFAQEIIYIYGNNIYMIHVRNCRPCICAYRSLNCIAWFCLNLTIISNDTMFIERYFIFYNCC